VPVRRSGIGTYRRAGPTITTSPANGSKLAAATRNAVIAFQLDQFDTATRTGWSVLGVGEAYEIVDPARLIELTQLQLDPWVRDHDAHTIRIPLGILTGRRISAGTACRPADPLISRPQPGRTHPPCAACSSINPVGRR
jgi:hypothetical protein